MDNKIMETENNEIKQPTSLSESEFDVIWQSICLKVTDEYSNPPEILRVRLSTIGTLGNFSASTGKAKSKKTFNVSAIVAAALSQKEVLYYSAVLPEDRRKILYIDTEQSKYHCLKVMKRILRLAGLPTDKDCPNLIFVSLREQSPKRRRNIIDYLLSHTQSIGLVVIDGIRDLMYDINNPTESTEIINLLMKWSSLYNLHIHTVLHLNKGDDNTRGHIGTELNNKAETVLQITKSPTNPDISEVKAMHIRDKEFDPFAFCINSDSLPVAIKDYDCSKEDTKRISLTDLPEEKHHEALLMAFSDGDIKGYGSLIKALTESYSSIGYERGRNTLVKHNKWLISQGYIVKLDKKYSLSQGVYKEK